MVKYLLSFAVIFSLSLYLEGKDPAPPSADQAAAMQAFMASMQPGKQHAELAKLAGDWNCACESFMPDGSVDKSTGTAKRTMIMGGRYLQELFKGTMHGQPFEGMFIIGYDNNLKKYSSVWIDSMTTGMAISQSKSEAANGFCTEGSMYCPIQKKEITVRFNTTVKSDSEELFEMRGPGPDGKEALMMRINYTRQK